MGTDDAPYPAVCLVLVCLPRLSFWGFTSTNACIKMRCACSVDDDELDLDAPIYCNTKFEYTAKNADELTFAPGQQVIKSP